MSDIRIFRIKARNKNNFVVNMCEYVSIQKLRMYGRDVWERYNRYATAELYEFVSGKWVKEPDQEKVKRLINPYGSDENN